MSILAHIDTSSRVRAVQSVNDLNMDVEEMIEGIKELIDDAPKTLDFDEVEAKLYLKAAVNYAMGNDEGGWDLVDERVEKLVRRLPQCIKSYSATPYYTPKTGAGTGKMKKGDKKAEAIVLWKKRKGMEWGTRKQWIELLVKEIGLTPQGASTYVYNLQRGIYK